jgi:hypothetical protein
MAPTVSAKKPTRVSERIQNLKKAATAATAATAAAAVTTDTITTDTITTKNARKGKTNRKAAPSKVTKRTSTKKAIPAPNKNAYAAHHHFFLAPEQLSDIVKQNQADGNQQMWVGGKFYAAGPGEEIPAGAIEIDIKVPAGLKFLVFPGVLRLVEGEEMVGAGELEEDEDEQLSE